MITVRAIGAAEVQIGRKRITKSTEMVLAVAAYLCVRAGERLTRDGAIDVFWPGGDLAKGRHSLRQMLYKLRLKGFTLDEDGESLFLDRARVDCDATRVLDDSWPETAEPWMIEDSGEFLPVVTRTISPQFQEWLDSTRSQVSAQYRRAAIRQIVQARREGRWADLERWARVVLRTDPLNEEATMARAESAAMAGSKSAALEILDRYVEELGERAGQIALPATVLRRRISERKPEWGGNGNREVPLVGRAAEVKQLTEAVECAANGRGGAFVLRGAAGIGKTRLIHETRAFATFAGFQSIAVRIPSSAPSQPLSVALTLIPQLLALRGAAGCPPLAMTLLRSATAPERISSVHPPANTSSDEIIWALCSLLEAVSEETRLFIHLDDLHHSDVESLTLIGRLAGLTGSLRLVWLATTRPSRASDGAPFRHTHGFVTMNIAPLSHDSSVQLAHEYSKVLPLSRSAFELQRLAGLSGGNPLFLHELSARRDPHSPRDGTPASLLKLIRERLSELNSEDVFVLRVVGLLGSLATIARVRTITLVEHAALADLLEQLSDSGILSVGPEGTLELHECWQEVVFDQHSPASLATLGLACAELLLSEVDVFQSLARVRRAAELLLEAGAIGRASVLFESAGDELRDRRLLAEAADAYQRSAAVLGTEARSPHLIMKLAGVQHAARNFESALATCESAFHAPSRFADASTLTHLRALQVDSLWKAGQSYREQLKQLAADVQNPDVTIDACHFGCLVGIRLLMNDRHSPLEQQFCAAIQASTLRSGPTTVGQLALLAYEAERGTSKGVLELDSSLARAPLDRLPPSLQCVSLRYRSTALRFVGEYETALALGTDAVRRATAFGLVEEIDLTALQLAFMSMDACDLESANEWLEKSKGAVIGVRIHERTRAHTHATGRLQYQQMRYEECLKTYSCSEDDPLKDILVKRKAVVCATMGAAAAETHRPELARRLIDECVGIVRSEPASVALDYATELATRAMISMNRSTEARSLASEYATRRMRHFNRPLAPFCREVALASGIA